MPNYRKVGALPDRHSDDVPEFYDQHPVSNQYLRVSDEPNISNPSGEKGGGQGVFAKKDIPSGTRLCPYVSKYMVAPCKEGTCQYDLRFDSHHYLCAKDLKFDLGYFMCLDPTSRFGSAEVEAPTPPNYARYINTSKLELFGPDETKFNCEFLPDPAGRIIMWVSTTRDVKKGEELFIDYGDSFVVI